MASGQGSPRISYETRLALLAFGAGFPATAVSVGLLWAGDYPPNIRWTLTAAVVAAWAGFGFAVRNRVRRPLQTLSNILAALQEGDYSIRARPSRPGDALDAVYRELNVLGSTLQSQRMGALEATALLRAVMAEIDVAVFTFDHERKLRLVNRAGERLLGMPSERMLGRMAEDLALEGFLYGEAARTVKHTFPAGAGRWGVRLSSFRQDGVPHRLLVVENLTRTLREEEVQAWKRLVRVIGHELNNSLAPIRSIAGSLLQLIGREPLAEDWREDARRGLGVIESRAAALTRFMEAYSRLARLPPPAMGRVDVASWIRRAAAMETRVAVATEPGPAATIQGDSDQLDQALINLIRNAADASLDRGGAVAVGWAVKGEYIEVVVRDEGVGLPNTANLFVPFFTTKPGGSGIGLVLSRQIAEAHGGDLALRNRREGSGCEAILRLRLQAEGRRG